LRSNKTTVTFGHDYVSNFFRLYKKFPAWPEPPRPKKRNSERFTIWRLFQYPD
jgi:hypothetical protein